MRRSVFFVICVWIVAFWTSTVGAQSRSDPRPRDDNQLQATEQRSEMAAVISAPAAARPAKFPAVTITEEPGSLQITRISRPTGSLTGNNETVVRSADDPISSQPEFPNLSVPSDAKPAGRLTIVFQTFYNRLNSTTIANAQGTAASFTRFFPRHGLLELRLEPLIDRGGFLVGENYFRWRGLPWAGRHWDFSLGDFRVSTALQRAPFTNIVQPDFFLRGVRVTARTSKWSSSVYGGLETLSQGQRVPYRNRVPQHAIGADTAGQLGQRLEVGFRYLHLQTGNQSLSDEKVFFPINRRFTAADTLTAQSNVKIFSALRWYTETGWSSARSSEFTSDQVSQGSFLTGPSFQSSRAIFHANYVRQGLGYLPVLGYYLGDRRGPSADGVLRLWRFDLSGSWGQLRNNLERNPSVPSFFSRQASGGLSIRLPYRFALSGSASKINLESRTGNESPLLNKNRQINFSLSRPLFQHSLRATAQQIDTSSQGAVQRLRFAEIEDTFHWSRYSIGGAARWQHLASDQRRDSLFFRGSFQTQFRSLTAYGYLENGQDLANSTLFAKDVFSTSVVGLSWSAPRAVTFQFEAFRNNLNSKLNPSSIFVLSGQGVPIDSTLSRYGNWSVYARVSYDIGWGDPLITDGNGEIQKQVPLVGTVAGVVKLRTMTGTFGAPGVAIRLDSARSAATDTYGYFAIGDVPEGTHDVSVDLDRLPANYDVGAETSFTAVIRPDQVTRTEFTLVPVQSITGSVQSASGEVPEGIEIRLLPIGRVTTTDKAGRFGFFDLPEGDYVVQLSGSDLPENARIISDDKYPIAVRYRTNNAPLEFIYEIVQPPPKPLRKVLDGHLVF